MIPTKRPKFLSALGRPKVASKQIKSDYAQINGTFSWAGITCMFVISCIFIRYEGSFLPAWLLRPALLLVHDKYANLHFYYNLHFY